VFACVDHVRGIWPVRNTVEEENVITALKLVTSYATVWLRVW